MALHCAKIFILFYSLVVKVFLYTCRCIFQPTCISGHAKTSFILNEQLWPVFLAFIVIRIAFVPHFTPGYQYMTPAYRQAGVPGYIKLINRPKYF